MKLMLLVEGALFSLIAALHAVSVIAGFGLNPGGHIGVSLIATGLASLPGLTYGLSPTVTDVRLRLAAFFAFLAAAFSLVWFAAWTWYAGFVGDPSAQSLGLGGFISGSVLTSILYCLCLRELYKSRVAH